MQNEQELATRAKTTLLDVLERDEKFIKVHAAEILNAHGEKARVREIFQRELERSNEVTGYRVGIWRVLAGASSSANERAQWISRITAVVADPAAADRVGAIESVGKLGHRLEGESLRAAKTMAESAPEADAMFAWWALHLAGDKRAMGKFADGLASSDPIARLRGAYVVGWEKIRQPAILRALAHAADNEARSAIGYAIILSAAVALDADPAKTVRWSTALNDVLANGAPGERYQICLMTSSRFAVADLARLQPLLAHENGDVRVGAAAAILNVLDRTRASR